MKWRLLGINELGRTCNVTARAKIAHLFQTNWLTGCAKQNAKYITLSKDISQVSRIQMSLYNDDWNGIEIRRKSLLQLSFLHGNEFCIFFLHLTIKFS